VWAVAQEEKSKKNKESKGSNSSDRWPYMRGHTSRSPKARARYGDDKKGEERGRIKGREE